MKAGEIVTEEKYDYPECLEGTPDGKLFYKVLEDADEKRRLVLKLFYIGRWRLKRAPGLAKQLGREFLASRNEVRLATEEEKAQIALASFME